MNEDIVHYLEARVEDLRKELASLEDQRKRVDDTITRVAELYQATNAVLRAERQKRGLESATQESPWTTTKRKLLDMSLKDAIRTIVRLHGEEGVHVNDILKRLKDAGFPLRARDPKASIAGTIHLEMKSEGTYEKVSPNTFRLRREVGE